MRALGNQEDAKEGVVLAKPLNMIVPSELQDRADVDMPMTPKSSPILHPRRETKKTMMKKEMREGKRERMSPWLLVWWCELGLQWQSRKLC